MSTILEGAAGVAAITGVLVATVAIILSLRSLTIQRRAFNVNALFDVVAKQYLDREFTSTEGPTIDGKKITKTRSLKARARKVVTGDPEAWSSAVTDADRWENRLAFEVSVALERLGIAVFSGSLPLRFLLPLAADQILEDWTICEPWVQHYRRKQKTFEATSAIQFHRRYAEWLTLLAALWMQKYYENYSPLKQVINNYGGPKSIRSLFLDRSHKEKDTMDPSTRADIRSLLGISV